MRMRNAAGGTLTGRRPLHRFRVPRSAFAIVVAACSPATTRPDFRPFPQAPTVIILARPERVIPALAGFVAAESLRVRRSSPTDGYLETDWYDTKTHRSYRESEHVPDLAHAIRLRCWADPYVPSETVVTIEPSYRPRYDPSRLERDLEVPIVEGQEGYVLATELVRQLKEKLGTPKTGP